MSVKTYQFFCDRCGWKRITDGSDTADLHEIKLSPVPRGAAKAESAEPKAISSLPKERIRKFRCPSCGFAVSPRRVKDIQSDIDAKRRSEEAIQQHEIEMEIERQRIAEIQSKDMEHDRKAEEERRRQRKLEAEMKLKEYGKKEN